MDGVSGSICSHTRSGITALRPAVRLRARICQADATFNKLLWPQMTLRSDARLDGGCPLGLTAFPVTSV